MPDKNGEWTERENAEQWNIERRLTGEITLMTNAKNVQQTRRDPDNHNTVIALAHLLGAKDAREHWYQLQRAAIAEYGDRHYPMRRLPSAPDNSEITPFPGCAQCDQNGHQYDRLNHQTMAIISGIYADHFPDKVKQQLRFYANLITWQTEQAVLFWRKAGRHASTLRPFLDEARQLANGRRSYY